MNLRLFRGGTSWLLAGLISISFGQTPASAQQPVPAQEATPAPDITLGAVTRLPLPRYVSLKGGEGNVRRGPGLEHRIDWIFQHPGMPLKITAEFGNWRRVEDSDGAGGWIHYALLSGVRTAIVQTNDALLHADPVAAAPVVARAEAGAIVHLAACIPDWCRVTADSARGWIARSELWGVMVGETLE